MFWWYWKKNKEARMRYLQQYLPKSLSSGRIFSNPSHIFPGGLESVQLYSILLWPGILVEIKSLSIQRSDTNIDMHMGSLEKFPDTCISRFDIDNLAFKSCLGKKAYKVYTASIVYQNRDLM